MTVTKRAHAIKVYNEYHNSSEPDQVNWVLQMMTSNTFSESFSNTNSLANKYMLCSRKMHSNLFHGMLNAVKVVSQMWARDTWNGLETDGHFYRSRYVKFPWPWIYVFFNRFPVARLLQALRLEYPFCPIRGFERNRNSAPKICFC